MKIIMLSGMKKEDNSYKFYDKAGEILVNELDTNDIITFVSGNPSKKESTEKLLSLAIFKNLNINLKNAYVIDNFTTANEAKEYL